jgi:hypothetical protein
MSSLKQIEAKRRSALDTPQTILLLGHYSAPALAAKADGHGGTSRDSRDDDTTSELNLVQHHA